MPESCDFVTLSELADFNCESLGTDTPAEFTFDYIDLSSVTTGSIDLGSLEQLRFADAPSRARRVVRDGDVLFGTVRPRLRSHALASDGNFVASTGFCVLRPRKCAASGRFLIHYLLSDAAERQARRLEVGSNYPAVTERDVALLEIPQFPLEEQRRIAEILDTIDETIQATERVIAKSRRVETALLMDSIDFSHCEARLGEVCSLLQDGTHLPPPRTSEGPLLLSVQNLDNGELRPSAKDTHVPEAFWQATRRALPIEAGDVCLAVVGATLGKLGVVPPDLPPFTVQRSLTVLRGDSKRMQNDYLFAVMRHKEFQRRLWQRVNQTAQPGVYLGELRAIAVPSPPLREQQQVVSVLDKIKATIWCNNKQLSKLHELRAGLAADLLSGRVRTVAA